MSLKTAKLIQKQNLTRDVFELNFEMPEKFDFIAGQFVTFKIPDRLPPAFRAYSISSAPGKKTFGICIKLVEGGRGTNFLSQMKIGEEIEFLGPNGKFILKSSPQKKVLFIATGTGIAPFKSILEDQLEQKSPQEFELIFGVRHETDVFYEEFFAKLSQNYGNFSYKITLSQPETENWHGETGRVTDILKSSNLSPQNTEIYICGLKNMIESVVEILKQKGFSDEQINFEKYD